MNYILSNSYELIKSLDPRQVDIRRLTGLSSPLPPAPKVEPKMEPLWNTIGGCRNIIRIAGIFGASAVVLGAYGAHTLLADKDPAKEEAKKVFETANRYHFYHAIALLAVPLSHYPRVTTFFLVAGMIMFCGPCYLQSLKEDTRFRKVTPFGGTSLILAWLTFLL